MSNTLNATLRALLEAITEFLPVSSTGHLFFFATFYPFTDFGEATEDFEDLFDIFIQSGAILSVIFLYYKKLSGELFAGIQYLSGDKSKQEGFQFVLSIVIGSFPIMLIGFLFRKQLDGIKSGEPLLYILGLAWFLGGIGILIQEWYFAKRLEEHTEDSGTAPLTMQQSIVIGFVQCVALIPGVSRSLATIVAGRSMGLSRKKAAEYSFFLAVPVLVAAGLYKLYKHWSILDGEKIWILVYGSVISFVLCIFVIKWFLTYIRRHSFSIFGYYRILLGFLVLIYALYLK
jgi:undecaprenyl-diphosphatase